MFGRLVVEDDIGKVIFGSFGPTRGLPVTIVRLAGLPNEVTNSVVAVLARLAFEIAFCCSGAYEINVLCEEAHRYISSSSGQAFGPARLAIDRSPRKDISWRIARGSNTTSFGTRPDGALAMFDYVRHAACQRAGPGDRSRCGGRFSRQHHHLLSSIADREAIAFGERSLHRCE